MNAIQILRLIQQIEQQQEDLAEKQRILSEKRRRLLSELAESMDAENYSFDDKNRVVQWASGKMSFKPNGWRLYGILQLLYSLSGNPVDFAEIAEVFWGDDCADVRSAITGLRRKLENEGFPKTIIVKNQTARLE